MGYQDQDAALGETQRQRGRAGLSPLRARSDRVEERDRKRDRERHPSAEINLPVLLPLPLYGAPHYVVEAQGAPRDTRERRVDVTLEMGLTMGEASVFGLAQRRGLKQLAISIPNGPQAGLGYGGGQRPAQAPQVLWSRSYFEDDESKGEELMPARTASLSQTRYPITRKRPGKSLRSGFKPRFSRTAGTQSPATVYDVAKPPPRGPDWALKSAQSQSRAPQSECIDCFWSSVSVEPVLVTAFRNLYKILVIIFNLGAALLLAPLKLIRAVCSPTPPWALSSPSAQPLSTRHVFAHDAPCSSSFQTLIDTMLSNPWSN